jgi:hypothetical protein
MAAVFALGPSAYYNVAPNIERAVTDASMRGAVAVQIFCVVFLAIMPFVAYLFSRRGHTWMTIALVVFNAMVAFQTANHRNAADTGGNNTTIARAKLIDDKLKGDLRPKRIALGNFEPAKKDQADALQGKLDEAKRDKRYCKSYCETKVQAVTTAQNNLDAMLARVTKTEDAAKLDAQIAEWEAKLLDLVMYPSMPIKAPQIWRA